MKLHHKLETTLEAYIATLPLKPAADSIVSILLIFMMKKCDQEVMITKTLETLDRVDGGRGILLLYSVKKCSKAWTSC